MIFFSTVGTLRPIIKTDNNPEMWLSVMASTRPPSTQEAEMDDRERALGCSELQGHTFSFPLQFFSSILCVFWLNVCLMPGDRSSVIALGTGVTV